MAFIGSRIPALREDYELGRLCGRYFLATVGKLLAEKCAAEPPSGAEDGGARSRSWFRLRRWPTIRCAAVVSDAPQANDTDV